MYRTLLILALVLPSRLLSPIPNGEKIEEEVSDEVKELARLHSEHQKVNLSDTNQQAFEIDGNEQLRLSLSSEDRQPNSRSAIFRHRGITEAKKRRYWNEKPHRTEDGREYAGIPYSPNDLAGYVFSTGDEEGVAIAIEELVREGRMGRTDAINYLQDVKMNLAYLKDQFEKQKQLEELKKNIYSKQQIHQMLPNFPREQFPMDLDKRIHQLKSIEFPPTPRAIGTDPPTWVLPTSTAHPKEPSRAFISTERPKTEQSIIPSSADKESKKDDIHKEKDLERSVSPKNGMAFMLEVIYKLAKDMFTQSILRDDPTAEETLSGLINFLESEVDNNKISSEMKEKVLEIVSAALVDSLRHYQGYLSEKQGAFDETSIYPHVADANGSLKVPASHVNRNVQGYDNLLQLASKSNRPSSN